MGKITKIIFSLLSLTVSLWADPNHKLYDKDLINYWHEEFRSLSVQERSALVKTFVKAIPYDFSYTLTAIHFKESYANRYFFNINSAISVDVGAFMINTKEYLRRQGLENNKWNTARAMEDLRDYDLNFSQAILTLESCLKKAKGDWGKAWGYYNKWIGSNLSYSKDIYAIIQVLKIYFSQDLYNQHKKRLKKGQ